MRSKGQAGAPMPVPADGQSTSRGAAGDAAPAYLNSRSINGDRFYGGNDARILVEGEVMRVLVRAPHRGLAVFACVFLPAYTAVAWLAIPDPAWRIVFGGVGPVVGASVFGFIYTVLKRHEAMGDYLVIDRLGDVIRLPRLKIEFPRSRAVGFQQIRGPSRDSRESETDLNLLVSEEPGIVQRYHVMGSPARHVVEAVADFSGLPVEKTDVRRGGFRDADHPPAAGASTQSTKSP